jgi:GH15 family glucan-1,4-alpha-glucosidase
MFGKMLGHMTASGLLSEDMDVETGELWGNFPQTYSMVGVIGSALRLSRSWEEIV